MAGQDGLETNNDFSSFRCVELDTRGNFSLIISDLILSFNII